MAQSVRLWRSERDGKPRGFWLASWRESGKKIAFNTRTLDKDEAHRKAVAELGRRSQSPVGPSPSSVSLGGTPPEAAPPPQLDTSAPPLTNGHRKPISDVLARAFSAGSPVNGAPPAPAPGPLEPSSAATTDEQRAKSKKLYEVFGRAMALLTEGTLRRACRYAGREPDEMDDDEIALVKEGWEEKGADWFGRTNIGPWGKIAMGSAVAGVGMWMGGKPIPAPKPKALPPAPPKPEPRKDGDSA